MGLLAKISLITGFGCQLASYTLVNFISIKVWFTLMAISFALFTLTIYLMSRGKWSLVAFVVFLSSLNALLDELFYNPEAVELNEYIGFLLTILLTIKFKNKWTR